ncbi:hypothetical protein Taro_024615 [Colocasia esculenta]|uniref:indole-3-pyruvate monooxygenase n=1 Tax=Colocasia esculenta TaxID=4460 RepID=A0A843V6R4_COLES|nr:hypothetical protein [Colocasia esculenta]
MLNEEGLPTHRIPNHWKGKKGLYCAGLSRNGLHGAADDANSIVDDIHRAYRDSAPDSEREPGDGADKPEEHKRLTVMETEVVIVGGGPAGLAVSACLNVLSIPNVVLEKEDHYAALWKKWSYDRLKLHIGKQYCELPHMPHPAAAPRYLSRAEFVTYLDDYAARFGVRPLCGKPVEAASFDGGSGTWRVTARNAATGQEETYTSRFLVAATGENSDPVAPEIPGLDRFTGEALHSAVYKSGAKYAGKRVLVVGSGNSGMEIALDLCNHGAKTAMTVRGPFHVLPRDLMYLGMGLVKYIPVHLVDPLVLMLCWLRFGDLSKFGIVRPAEGPFYIKAKTGRPPIIDVGTVGKIKSGELEVMKVATSVNGDEVTFADGETRRFDAIVLATGYKNAARKWLKAIIGYGEGGLLKEDGFPVKGYPNHWKGSNGLYCAGLSKMGLAGCAMDAMRVAEDIERACQGAEALRKGEMEMKLKTT